MKRREFITLLGGAAAWPVAARAQQEGVRRIGVLTADAEDVAEVRARLAALREGLERLGWSEGRTVRIDYRFAANNPDRYRSLAKELVRLQPDVLFAHTTPIAVAFQRETRTIPIVFVSVSDPVGSGLVASLARRGGNLTGFLWRAIPLFEARRLTGTLPSLRGTQCLSTSASCSSPTSPSST
jgi:putative tryptophan/tyrosine transport system substrate-binding protein